jgi:hypothetical protein
MPSFKDNHRKRSRRSRSHLACITFAGEARCIDCNVVDISADGAKLLSNIVAPAGTRFYLSNDPTSLERKECLVIWQRNRTLGVKFV